MAPVAGEQFKLLERALGFTYLPGSLLLDATVRGFLRPASAHRYDPMHTLVGNGVAHFELANLFCRCLAKIPRFSYAMMREYLSADWGTPTHLGVRMQSLKSLFTDLRQKDLAKNTFKADASPMLALFPLVRHFARTCLLPLGSLGEEVASLEACGRVLDEYVMIKRGGRGNMWADAIRAFLEQHRQTYGEETMKPKHHWLLHLPSQLRRDGVLVDTFPLERLHRKVKTYAENCRAAEHYERSIVANCFLAHCRSFEQTPAVDGLLPPILPWGELSLHRASASTKMLFSHLQLVAGDFVFLDGHLVEVQMFC